MKPTIVMPITNKLPFYTFFNALRHSQEFPLGIAEYHAFLEALQGGWGMNKELGQFDKNKIFELCKLLWLKPNQSYVLFEEYFEQYYPLIEPITNENNTATKKDEPPNSDNSNPSNEAPKQNAQDSATQPEPKVVEQLPNSNREKTRLNIDYSEQGGADQTNTDEVNIPFKKFLLTDDYFPLPKRQLQQIWRNLPQSRKTHGKRDLDIPNMVKKIAQKGFLDKIQYKPQHEIINEIVVLCDHDGSMTAFEQLNDLIAETLSNVFPDADGRSPKIHRFYFYNIPQTYLYKNKAHTQFVSIDNFVRQFQDKRVALIIISDAGAARGSNSSARVRPTIRILLELQKITHKIAWLNPMPRQRWTGTSAARIANFAPMFACETQELRRATLFLKGKIAAITP